MRREDAAFSDLRRDRRISLGMGRCFSESLSQNDNLPHCPPYRNLVQREIRLQDGLTQGASLWMRHKECIKQGASLGVHHTGCVTQGAS